MNRPATLRPLAGAPGGVERLVTQWLATESPDPVVVRTSGSSGEPKDVALSVQAVTASARATLARVGGPGQWVLALPVHYVAGLQVVVRSVLAGTSPVVLGEHVGLASAAAAMTHQRRYLAIVPTQLHRMLANPGDADALARFDAVLLGGAAAPPDVVDAARRRGIAVVTTYGMSETCGGCVYDGRPLDGVSVRLDSDDRILIAGAVLFDGYVGRPDLTANVLVDGWLRAPDIGKFEPDGRLTVLGRADDIVVSGGVNVPLAAIETILRTHPAVQEVAVVGLPDAEWGQRVVAVVVPRAGGPAPELGQLRDLVGAAHAREWAPRQVVVESALPMLESGKIDRQSLLRSLTDATRA